jgi:hypothetical protein
MILRSGIFFLMIVCAANSLFAGNLFSAANSGFETSVKPWYISTFNSSFSADTALDTAGAIFGKKYCKVTVKKIAKDSVDSNWVVQLWDPTWQSKKNVSYTFRCWAKTDSVMNRTINVAATGDSASQYPYQAGQNYTLTKTWQLCSLSYTWTMANAKSHFVLYIAGARGVYCFDSMALDSHTVGVAVKNPLAISYRSPSSGFSYQLLPNCIRFDLGNSLPTAFNVAVYSLEGRLLSSRDISSAVSTFEIPKPASGAWIMDVNSNKKVIRIP